MLGNKKNQNKTVFGGIGIALLLCALMALMPMSGFMSNDSADVEFVETSTTGEEDYFSLPDKIEEVEYEYDPSLELQGMRDQTTKAYLTEDGNIAQLIATEPVHYRTEEGTWENVDLNIKAMPEGWSVTENTFVTHFGPEAASGLMVQANQFVDPVVSGLNPMLVTLDETGTAPQPYFPAPAAKGIEVGGNVIRYPLAEGFDLDYTVESTQVKQNLIVREAPVVEPNAVWFGLSEGLRIPAGYALYSGEIQLGEEIFQTQEGLQIRNIETGELLLDIPSPMIIEGDNHEPYIGTFFVQVYGPDVILTTVVETSWLLSEDRVFPLGIDPTLKVYQNAGGYCYVYYNNCYSNTLRYLYKYYSSVYYLPWHKVTFTSSNALPSGAAIQSIKWKEHISSYSYASANSNVQLKVLQECGVDQKYNWAVTTRTCSSAAISPSKLVQNYGGTNARSVTSSIWNSPTVGTIKVGGTGWKTGTLCNSATACSSTTGGIGFINTALSNAGTSSGVVGIGDKFTGSRVLRYGYSSGSNSYYLEMVYTGGTDADAPTSDYVPYTGLDSYIEGERTFFIKLTDMSGIDTTSSNAPKLVYSTDGGTSWSSTTYGLGSNNKFDGGEVVSIGTCASSATDCRFRARTPAVSFGDDFRYYWKYQDLNQGSNGANVGYEPALTGTQTTPTAYQFDVVDPANAPTTSKKMTVLTTDVTAYNNYRTGGMFDRQLTYYAANDEYFFEFDTSSCGTGSNSCFYTGTSTTYGNWLARWSDKPAYGYWGMNSYTNKGNQNLWNNNGNGYLWIGATNGPNMNLVMLYDSTDNKWATVGIGTETGIEAPLAGGSSASLSYSYGSYTQAYKFAIPGDITGDFGMFTFNSTASSTTANRMCVTTNGWYYFYRATGYDRCTPAYYMIYGSTNSYRWSGFAMGSSYYGRAGSNFAITYKVGNVAPTPDTFAPEYSHSPMADSHAADRTISVKIMDAGDPASGLNTSTSAGVGPTLYHRITPDGGTAGSWTSTVMDQEAGNQRADCKLKECIWSADVEDLEVNDTVEYYFTSRDVSTVASGINANTSSTYSFERGDPNKVFVVEWHDMSYYTYGQLCTVQAHFYDVTNEIEFKYDSGCKTTYESWSIGYMDQTRNKGSSISHKESTSFNSNPGHTPTTTNFRVHTSATSDSWETFDKGLVELANANTALSGSSNGFPYSYYCWYYWSSYKNSCAANVDLPAGFEFEYFGTTYDGDDSNDRVQINRQGSMFFVDNGNTNTQRTLWTWHQPELPYKGSSYARAGMIAPFWTVYNNYYCFVTTQQDCSTYYRVMPYEGKGTDVSADITSDPHWDLTDSPIRINPSNKYLVVSSDLTIEPGVEIQVASGKGISFEGACTKFFANGSASAPINFTGLNGAKWLGMAFTDDCTTSKGTDDRHIFKNVNFNNTTDAVFRSGSRHDGTGPSCGSSTANCNTGNYTMSDVTFTNVGSVFTHGSGQGTVVTMTDFSIDGVNKACFNFPENSVATLIEGSIKNCNTDGESWGGTIVNYPGSSSGALHAENLTVENSYVNFIDVDLQDVTLSNITVSNPSAQTGVAIDSMHGSNSDVYISNVDVDSYANSGINAMGSMFVDGLDIGSADLWVIPGGWSQTGNGPSSTSMKLMDLTAGDITMARVHPGVFADITAEDVSITGNHITSEVMTMTGFDIDAFTITGCGWSMNMVEPTVESIKSSASCANAKNTMTVSDATITHGASTESVIDGRNSHITVGESSFSSTSVSSSGPYVAKARSGTNIVLIESDLNGNDCSGSSGDTGNCAIDVSSSSSNPSMVYFGGLASIRVFRLDSSNNAVYKPNHVVTTSLVDASLSEMFQVGLHKTSSSTSDLGNTSVWVVVGDSDSNSFDDHIIRAFGSAGQNETYPDNFPDATLASDWYPSGGFTIGTHMDLQLEPAPITFNDPTTDCNAMRNNVNLSGAYDAGTDTFAWDDTKITITENIMIDGCHLRMDGGVLRVQSTANNAPVITIKDGGSITLTDDGTSTVPAVMRAVSPTYGMNIDIQDGTLALDHGILRDVACDTTTMGCLNIGNGATLTMMDSGTIYGSSATSDEMATVKVDGGTVNIAGSSIINDGQTGTALWVQNTGGTINDITVKNAAVGIQSHNGAPQIDGFIANGNTIGVSAYGGMSLPTIYRSTILSGMSAGWETYEIDLSTYLGTGNYLQVGANSIYAGGNAHPTYNYGTSKYYFITDRMNIEFTDDAGNSWNITDSDQKGYYPYSSSDPAENVGDVGSYNGGVGGAPSWHCNYYGYDYGPNFNSQEGYYYYMHRYWLGKSGSINSYDQPDEFGFRWESIEDVSPTGYYASRYPYKYWGYYSPANYFQGAFSPPEGSNGQSNWVGAGNPLSYATGGYPNNYGICLDYAYTYYMNSGQGARVTWPIVDISGAAANGGNITKVSLWIDVIHKGADNYQDRYDFVARSGNDPSSLGDYVRESGTAKFENGQIIGSEIGMEIGGAYAAGDFSNIEITSPTTAGVLVSGSSAATSSNINVTGGDYGVLVGTSASGRLDLNNVDLENQALAGVYYLKDLNTEFSGTITGSAGPALKYGVNTDRDVTFSSINIENNAVGIESMGGGQFTLTDVVLDNTKDVIISGSAKMDFIEGEVDTATIDVTGTGEFSRMRQVDITVTADVTSGSTTTTTNIDGTNVVLKDPEGVVTGMAETDSNGVASDLTFVTQTVDSGSCSNVCTPNLNGYTAVTVATIDYYWTNSGNNNADFRYAFETLALTDTVGNAEAIDLVEKFDSRFCYRYTSVSYIQQNACGNLGTGSSRTFSNGLVEYGYYYTVSGNDVQGDTIMFDAPIFYLDSGTHDWNNTNVIVTASYEFNNANNFYPRYNSEVSLWMHDATVTATAVSSTSGQLQGFQLGYQYYAMNLDMDNTTISGLATIWGAIGYGNYNQYELDYFNIANSSFTHFKGYTQLNSAIQITDICLTMNSAGSDGSMIYNNSFYNCGGGILLQRSPYYYTHSASELGADNVTIDSNEFHDGGEIADVWLYTSNEAQGTVITNNEFNPTGGRAISVYNGKTADLLIQDNTIVGGKNAISVNSASNFTIHNNTIGGISDPASTGIQVFKGTGDVTNNTLVDADGGIYLSEMKAPPAPTSSLCSITSNGYRTTDSCTFTLGAGKTVDINLGTDSWGYEIAISISKPGGQTDSWGTYSFASNTEYNPLVSYSTAGSYTITVTDSFGDGGANINALEATQGSTGYVGPDISGNTIGLSAGRTSPNAVGITATDCNSVIIQSGYNTINLGDNAIVIEDNCEFVDEGSSLTGNGDASTIGLVADDTDRVLTLNGTTISGYATGLIKENGDLIMFGGTDISGTEYGVHADSTTVTAMDASVDGGAAGTGLYAVDSPDVWVYPLDASGLIGVHIDNSPFRWDGGTSDATTAIYVEDSTGSVENLTWSASPTQINAGPNSHVTSIGNTLLSGNITIDSTSVIDEANLLSMETTHLGDAPEDEVALLVTSTDDERASYVSTSFQPETMSVDGSDADWNGGNALNPSGFAMPGHMSGDGTNDFLVTYVEGDSLYLGMEGSDLTNSDVLIYLSVDGSGSNVGYNGLGGSHNLPFSANYVLWADSDSSFDLYSYGFLGWGPSSLSTANVDVDFSTSFGEISIPWSRIGGMPDQIDIVAMVQAETTADISTVHPTQTLDAGATLQNLSSFMTVELTHGDLMTGSLSDEVLVYRTYKGVVTPSAAKNYDIMLKTPADCEYDWETIEDVSMSTNVVFDDNYVAGSGETTDVRDTVDILRACPVIDTEGSVNDDTGLSDFNKDEDSGAFTFSLTNLVDDVQDLEANLDWQVTEGTLVAFDNILVDWAQNSHDVTITPLDDQFGYMVFAFEVTDSNGLTDSHNITYTVNNINDKPVICNNERVATDCMPIFSEDDSFNNILPEGFGTHTKFLGDVSNATRSYIRDMANEQSPDRQAYTWSASVPSTCDAFSVAVVNNELTITENVANEAGGTCMVTLGLSDDGSENTNADDFDVAFSVSPVNDAPVIRDWDAANGTTIVNKANLPINQAWKLVMTEDDTNVDNLTFNLSAVKTDVDHEMDDLVWTVESTDQCTYTNYFTTTIIGNDLVFDLIEDAATDVPNEERDYLNNNGIHQIPPTGSSYCQITLVLRDTPTAPTVAGEYNTHIPNYDTSLMPIADYQQGVATKTLSVKVTNVPEQVPDYAFDAVAGFSFNGVTNVMTGTYVPVTVSIDGAGDPGPYRYDHMLAVTFHSDGHDDIEQTRYYDVPDYNGNMKITEDVYVTRDSTHVWVEMDVLTCLDNPCDLTASTADRFIADDPASHYRVINGVQSDEEWSAPGRYGQDGTTSSIRRPLLEDSNWCNNIMTSLGTADPCNAADQNTADTTFLATEQALPKVVDTIGASAVPSFAPSIIAVAMAGLFVSALSFSSRRADDEEELETTIKDDDTAVSPVIATILMVAITVVLSGVIYVWASALAETDVKGVPRITFQIEDIDGSNAEEGHWRISVNQAGTALATQAVQVRVFYLNETGGQNVFSVNLAESAGVYGFNPANSDAFVSFVDSVDADGNRSISTFNSGDVIFVRTHAPDGTPLTGAAISITYAPPAGDGSELIKWSNLDYNKKA
mgnify:CR=1 FL=1